MFKYFFSIKSCDEMKWYHSLWIISILSIIVLIGIFFIFSTPENPLSETNVSSEEAIEKALDYLKSKMQEDGSIHGPVTTAWVSIAANAAVDNDSEWMQTKEFLINYTQRINLSVVTDVERHALALMAFNVDPTNCTGRNFIDAVMNFYDGTQIGDPDNLFDDAFGLLVLRSYGLAIHTSLIQNVTTYLSQQQNTDGGWGDVDVTAAVIMALSSCGEEESSDILDDAKMYLKTKQNESGGFYSWGSENSASTSWAICSIYSMNENPRDIFWIYNDYSPIDYLLRLQQSDGSFAYTSQKNMNAEWMTAYALLALSESSFLVSYTHGI